jgi:hypothetical protein
MLAASYFQCCRQLHAVKVENVAIASSVNPRRPPLAHGEKIDPVTDIIYSSEMDTRELTELNLIYLKQGMRQPSCKTD